MSPLRHADGDKVTFTREAWIGLATILLVVIGGLISLTSRLSAVETKVDFLMEERPSVRSTHSDSNRGQP